MTRYNQKNSSYQYETLQAWDCDKIEVFFKYKDLPETIQLDPVTKITDVPKMINSHINFLRANNGKVIYEPYYSRLRLLATKL